MNETLLRLKNGSGDFQVFREEDLQDPARRPQLLELMLEEDNFGRLFPWWKRHAGCFGLTPEQIRNTTSIRNYLRKKCGKLCIPAV